VDWFAHLSLPLFSLTLRTHFPSFNYDSHSIWHLLFCFPLNTHLLCSKWISINI
jgi:hypothetical protein